ncbi:MAG: hypothetical protein Q8M69_25720, partial [Reyranella sp.]|nr:hypothetical protein [Reyranella sp.]
MRSAAVRRAALVLALAIIAPAAAQQDVGPRTGAGSQPMTFFPPQANSPAVQLTQPTQLTPKFELPSSLPSIPSGVAVIPPPESQSPRLQTPLPTTTPMPPANVATPIVPPTIPPGSNPPVPAGAQRPSPPQ